SLAACARETVELLTELASSSGRQGEADRLARRRLAQFEGVDIERIFQSGLHEFLRRFVADNVALDHAIAQQFRFG
ncbi:MAG TPA: alpha-E domain-containing protein, partial [Allosphingosinicella sp.]|nr:alpha-E domain-containing protein [Allosphingosinicella sp.]